MLAGEDDPTDQTRNGIARRGAAAGSDAGDEARELYGAELALVRPDQIVAWRGARADGAAALLARLCARPPM